MNKKKSRERRDTTYSKDDLTVFVRLRVDRRAYEFARSWAAFHAMADPKGTAEDHLEGYLNATLARAMADANWQPPKEIEALYPAVAARVTSENNFDDEVPF